jgi:hypothetical protein
MPANPSGEGVGVLQKWHAIEAKPFAPPKSKGSPPSWFRQPSFPSAKWTDCFWLTRWPPGATRPLFFNGCMTLLTALDPKYQPDMEDLERSCLPWGWTESPGRKRHERFSDLVRRCTTATDPRLQLETAYVNKPLCSHCKVMVGDNVSSIEHLANLTVESPTFQQIAHGSTLETFADALRDGCFICCTAFRQFERLRMASGGKDSSRHPHMPSCYAIGPVANITMSFKCVPEFSCLPQELRGEIPLSLEVMCEYSQIKTLRANGFMLTGLSTSALQDAGSRIRSPGP